MNSFSERISTASVVTKMRPPVASSAVVSFARATGARPAGARHVSTMARAIARRIRCPLRCPRRRSDLGRLDAGELDHLAPLLGLARDQLAEILRRAGQRYAAEGIVARLDLRIEDRRIDRLVELEDDVVRRALGRADAAEPIRLVAGHELRDRRH